MPVEQLNKATPQPRQINLWEKPVGTHNVEQDDIPLALGKHDASGDDASGQTHYILACAKRRITTLLISTQIDQCIANSNEK